MGIGRHFNNPPPDELQEPVGVLRRCGQDVECLDSHARHLDGHLPPSSLRLRSAVSIPHLTQPDDHGLRSALLPDDPHPPTPSPARAHYCALEGASVLLKSLSTQWGGT